MSKSGTAVKPTKARLDDDQRAAVDFIEQTFWETGGMPTCDKVEAVTGVRSKRVEKWLKDSDLFRKALIARGVDLQPDVSDAQLSTAQLMCANLLMNTHDKRTEREKLAFLGISSQQYHAWLRQPAFANYLRTRAESLFSASDHKAYNALLQNVEEGDLNAVKLHFEMRGKYRNQLDVNINIETVVVQLVEIVAKHVKDPELLQAIALDVESLELR